MHTIRAFASPAMNNLIFTFVGLTHPTIALFSGVFLFIYQPIQIHSTLNVRHNVIHSPVDIFVFAGDPYRTQDVYVHTGVDDVRPDAYPSDSSVITVEIKCHSGFTF